MCGMRNFKPDVPSGLGDGLFKFPYAAAPAPSGPENRETVTPALIPAQGREESTACCLMLYTTKLPILATGFPLSRE